jgi:hypothetical protein
MRMKAGPYLEAGVSQVGMATLHGERCAILVE